MVLLGGCSLIFIFREMSTAFAVFTLNFIAFLAILLDEILQYLLVCCFSNVKSMARKRPREENQDSSSSFRTQF